MSRLNFWVVVFLSLGMLESFAQQFSSGNIVDSYDQELIVKLLPQNHRFFDQQQHKNSYPLVNELISVSSTFPNANSLIKSEKQSSGFVDLSLIYTLKVNSTTDLKKMINRLEALGVFQYVERPEVNRVAFTPNDLEISKQSYLTQVKAFLAWDIEKGNSIVKIGIVDTGTEMVHPDLQSKIAKNANDPINGVDDDLDGFVDNFQGWDFEDDDGNPQFEINNHGAHVSGIAAAATNNVEGVASVGYNTMFLPIRVGRGTEINYGYEGIVYAADMGCDIINCSWGNFSYSEYEQDVINYAAINKGALIVAAAGNKSRDQEFYPAAYENVLAVTSVNSGDIQSTFTNYGYWADISCPGENVYSTIGNGAYNYNTGTSMAAPVVSGAAALIKSKYPTLTAGQISERLKSSADDISNLNPSNYNKIGKGRLNVFESVNGAIVNASVVFEKIVLTNKDDDAFKGNDSLFISGSFINYLAASGNVVASVSTVSPYVVSNKTLENIGVMPTLSEVSNSNDPFSYKILDTAPLNTEVVFKIEVTDGTFTNDFFVKVVVNVDYLNIAINQLSTSVGSKGQFGYNERNQNQGLGVRYNNGNSQFFEGGVMIGTNDGGVIRVLDRVRTSGNSWDDDFQVEEYVHVVTSPLKGDYAIQGIYNDSNSFSEKIGLKVLHHSYASLDPGHEDYIVFEYQIINNSGSDISSLNVGLFADFDVANFDKNACYTDKPRYLTYTICTEPNTPVFGVQLLTSDSFGSYCLDNVLGGQGGIDIFNGFTASEKLETLTTNRQSAGIHAVEGNDVIQVTSTRGVSVAIGDTMKVAFVIMGADDLSLLKGVADSAYKRYNGQLPNSVGETDNLIDKVKIYPNPVVNSLFVDVSAVGNGGLHSLRVYDLSGRVVYSAQELNNKTTIHNLDYLESGVYFVEIQVGNKVSVTKLIKN